MRIRTVKPEWLDDEKLLALGSDARVMSIALILMADDYGDGRANEMTLAGRVFPTEKDATKKTRESLARLVGAGFVHLYTVRGQRYYNVRKWAKHQKVDHPSKPIFPQPHEADNLNHSEGLGIITWISRESREYLDKAREHLASDQYLDLDQYQDQDQPPVDSKKKFVSTKKDRNKCFALWKELFNHPKAVLDAKREKAIEFAIVNFGLEGTQKAIRGAALDDWTRKHNNKITWILKDGEQIEHYMAKFDQSEGTDLEQQKIDYVSPNPTKHFVEKAEREQKEKEARANGNTEPS